MNVAGSNPVPSTNTARVPAIRRKGGFAMSSNEEPSHMRGNRPRDVASGELRRKRSDTHIGTIEQEYNRDFKVRSDMKLGTYLKQTGKKSLDDLLKG